MSTPLPQAAGEACNNAGPDHLQLIADSLVLVRGGRTIINRLSLTVAGGEALILSGPNGSGKTTLLRALAGFLAPEEGSIRLDGGEADRGLAEQCHYLGHLNGIKASLTVAENLAFWAAYLGAGDEDMAADKPVAGALAGFDLQALADIPVAYLSAGQKRRASLARLLVATRPVWLLDEPTVSLDTTSVELLARAVNAHAGTGGIAIVATHVPIGLTTARELRLGLEQVAA